MTSEGAADGEAAVDFGYRRVRPEYKAGLVRDVFGRVARRYDLMNDLMSAGVHRLWKQELVDWLAPRPGALVLDVAGGTGDVACRVFQRMGGRGRVIVCDASATMVAAGRDRGYDSGTLAGIDWVVGYA